MGYRAGADIGGTFTDLVLMDDTTGEMHVGKVLTTVPDPERGIITGLQALLTDKDPAAVTEVIHGTTLMTNALIERKGAATALLTTAGHRDALEIRQEHRFDLYDLNLQMPEPLVPRCRRIGIRERVLADGSVLTQLDETQARAIIADLRAEGVEAVAVALLHAYKNPAHEQRLGGLLAEAGLTCSLSHEVVSEIREYERTSTTVANVYVRPLTERYLSGLRQRLDGIGVRGRLLVMLSSGGLCTVDTACRFPIRLVESGPAGGALAAAAYSRLTGEGNLLSFDMGGTTAKACLIDGGEPLTSTDFEVARVYRFKKGSGYPVKVPVVEMIEIGAGGGSIARVDNMGLIKVGPDSAGSSPGPACYGSGGTLPTVSDADLLLGYLNPGYFLGGRMRLDRDAAEQAVRLLADRLGLDPIQAAWGVHRLVNENMAAAARVHAMERGRDLRPYVMFGFGGAGPVHACGVAQLLGMHEVMIPLRAGVGSAFGFLAAPLAFDFVRSHIAALDGDLDWAAVNTLYTAMEAEGRALLPGVGVTWQRTCSMRYQRQGSEITVPIPAGRLGPHSLDEVQANFDRAYTALYGRTNPRAVVEAVNWRLAVVGPKPALRLTSDSEEAGPPQVGERSVYWPAVGFAPTPVLNRYRLPAGYRFPGPAIVEDRESTTVVPPGSQVAVDEHLSLRIRLGR